jgi:undecaprenyl-diphosphatase
LDLLQAFVLGIVQGATEYLPVSSSAHLAIAPWLFGWPKPSFAFDVLVQLGTLVGVVLYYRRQLHEILSAVLAGLRTGAPFGTQAARDGWYLVVATIPAVVIGALIKDSVEEAWGSITHVLVELAMNGLLLIAAEAVRRRRTLDKDIDLKRSVFIGCWQALAILPAISRSGATIAGAMIAGVDKQRAADFSFLMSIPVMLGAGVLAMKDLVDKPGAVAAEGPAIAIGFVAAAVSGYFVIRWFLAFLRRFSLAWFGLYCLVVSAVALTVIQLQ